MKNIDMQVNIGETTLKNPVIAASGTFISEYDEYFDLSLLGGISYKGVTKEPRQGNPGIRIAESPSGIVNSVGLQNPGVEQFVSNMKDVDVDTIKIANVAGAQVEDYLYVIEKLEDANIDMIELNVSCPNVKEGGVSFGTSDKALFSIVSKVKLETKHPLVVKLTPNVTNIAHMAVVAQDAGADAISLINTFTALPINARTRRPVLGNVTGGLSGPAIKPIALRMVYEVHKNISIPVIGMGGIMTGEDVAEFMLAGASAVMIGSATLSHPKACVRILDEFESFLSEEGISSARELTGQLLV